MQFFYRLAAIAAVPFIVVAAPLVKNDGSPGKYIILFKPDVDVTTILSHHNTVREIHARNKLRRDIPDSKGLEFEYGFGDFHAYVGEFDAKTIAELQNLPEVGSPSGYLLNPVDEP